MRESCEWSCSLGEKAVQSFSVMKEYKILLKAPLMEVMDAIRF